MSHVSQQVTHSSLAELSLEEMGDVQGGGTLFCDLAGLAVTVGTMPELGPGAAVAGLVVKNVCETVTDPGFSLSGYFGSGDTSGGTGGGTSDFGDFNDANYGAGGGPANECSGGAAKDLGEFNTCQ